MFLNYLSRELQDVLCMGDWIQCHWHLAGALRNPTQEKWNHLRHMSQPTMFASGWYEMPHNGHVFCTQRSFFKRPCRVVYALSQIRAFMRPHDTSSTDNWEFIYKVTLIYFCAMLQYVSYVDMWFQYFL